MSPGRKGCSIAFSAIPRPICCSGPDRLSLARDSGQLVLQHARMQTVVVTGASSGIGRAAALRFAREGASVLAVGRQANALDDVAKEIRRTGGSCQTLKGDVTESTAPVAIVDAALASFGGITTLVNAAGIIASGTLESCSWSPGSRASLNRQAGSSWNGWHFRLPLKCPNGWPRRISIRPLGSPHSW